jgi:hypothetical protein
MRSFGETPLHARKRVSAMTVQSVTRSLPWFGSMQAAYAVRGVG